ncbi:MAG: DUF6337 family protein [Bacteroidaceae bacterium]|nr:DUF6337 family protein [Bacteroidaceae bacterium]
MNAIILISFLIEVGVLLYLEKKAWNTIYTPLSVLMLPYLIVLLITIMISGHFGFDKMCYPSILVWSVALLVFAIPSQYLGYSLQKNGKPYYSVMECPEMPPLLLWISVLVCLGLLFRFKQAFGSSPFSIGTEEFTESFDGKGVWSHISRLNSIMLTVTIFFVDRKHRYLWIIILMQLVLLVIHNVKGWIFVPVVAGMIMRLSVGKSKLTFRFVLFTVLGVVGVFIAVYLLALVVGDNVALNGQVVGFIFRHVIHYLTSGILGFSTDMLNGFPDRGDFELNIAQFVNIFKALTGDHDYLSTINPLYYNTGFNLTNVRTMFGTIFINSNYVSFVLTVFVISCVINLVQVLSIRHNGLYANLILSYFCSLLFMGWFDNFFSQLATIEVPGWILALWLADRLIHKKDLETEVMTI